MSGILLFKKMSLLSNFSLIPVIFVSKTKAYDHRVNAFEMGAADFLTTPFDSERVLEITDSQLKNSRRFLADGTVRIGNMQFHPGSRSVLLDEQKVKLTDLEFKILQYLLITPRNVITRTEICQHVWGDEMVNTGRLDTQLYNLKKKIAAFNGKIKSVNKIGMRVLAGETTFYQAPEKPVLQSLLPPRRPS
jgi:DNA-binding response OmpR family regulator